MQKDKKDWLIKTNIGEMPIENYREIAALAAGFDSYDEMYKAGLRLGNGYDREASESDTLESSCSNGMTMGGM